MASTTTVGYDPQCAAKTGREIEVLANSNLSEGKFFREFLERLVRSLDAELGAVWRLNEHGQLSIFGDVCRSVEEYDESVLSNGGNVQLLLDVLQTGEAVIHAPDGISAEVSATAAVIAIVPLLCKERVVGVVEMFLGHDDFQAAETGQFQFVKEMCRFASRYLSWRNEAMSTTSRLEFSERLQRMLAELHRSLHPTEVATIAANDGRVLLGCDRVSIAARRGRQTVLLAISGQSHVQHHSNLVRALRLLTTKVLASGEPFVFQGQFEGFALEIKKPLHDFVYLSGSRMVHVIPFAESKPLIDVDEKDQKHRPKPSGALILEHSAADWLTPVTQERSGVLAEHISRALQNALTHHGIFLLPLWRFLGQCRGWFRGRNLLKAVAALAFVAAVVFALTGILQPYRVEGTGKLMPVVQRTLFAPWDVEVVEIFVASGERVDQNQKLLKLRNDELNTQLLAIQNKLDQSRQVLRVLQAEADNVTQRSTPNDGTRLRGRIAQTKVEIEGLTRRLKVLQQQMSLLTVRSPIAGTVVTFQLDQLLLNRPVRRGDVLLDVMDEQQRWHLELQVPEHRMGHLLRAQNQHETGRLPVEFVLATAPELRFDGVVEKIATRTGHSESVSDVIEVTVAVDKNVLPDARIGAAVDAKITCVDRSLLYVLFGDVIEFFQKRFW